VHYLADLQSVHGLRCYAIIAPNAKCQRVLILALCLVVSVVEPRVTDSLKRVDHRMEVNEAHCRNVMLMQQLLPALRQTSSEFIFQ